MAEPAQIEMVKDLLPADAAEDGWNEEKISVYLDGGSSVYQAVALFWEGKAARLYQMIDVSEAGSSRSLGQVYDNARSMAEYWRDQEEQAKSRADDDDTYRRPAVMGRIKRV